MTDDSTPDPAEPDATNPDADAADVSAAARCPQCGAEIPADAPAGLCPRCLLQLGFESQQDNTPATDPYRPPFVAPLPEHLAPHFPQLEIVERIGHGGMGVVYRAKQINLDRAVALKILRPDVDTDPNFAERFEREAKLLGRLNHPHIVGIHDYGKTGSLFYLIMEYVDGQNLRQLERGGQLSAAEALAIVPQICEALQYAHGQGVVHRDIKPENILINTAGQVKIADFGIAKLTELGDEWGLTGQWQVMGTPHYMAPEQIERPLEVDHRADIYSLGVVLYEMLTGELPLGRFGVPSMRAKVDVRLDEVVLRSLEKEPQRRYQRVTEVQTDLEHVRDTPTTTGGASHTATSSASLRSRLTSLKQQWFGGASHGTNWPAGALVATGGMEIGLAACLLLLAPLQGRETMLFLVMAFTCLCFGIVAALAGLFLQKREYPLATLIALAISLLPASLGWFVRAPLALWAAWSIRDSATRAAFTSPPWEQSQSYRTLSGVAEASADTAKSTASTARQVTIRGAMLAAGVASLRSVRTGVSGILLATAWTLICVAITTAVQIGWSQVFPPQRWQLSDSTAQQVDNHIGLVRFSITGSGTTWQPSLPDQRPLVLKRIQFAVYPQDGRLARLSIDLDHDVPICSDPSTSTNGPFTKKRLDDWLTSVQPLEPLPSGEESADVDEAYQHARQLSRDNLFELVQQLHGQAREVETKRVPLARWFSAPAMGSSSIASLLDRSVFKPTRFEPRTVRRSESLGTLLSGTLMVTVWMFGLVLVLFRSLQRVPQADDKRQRRFTIAQLLLYVSEFMAALLALTSFLADLGYQQGYLDLCQWLGNPESRSLRALLLGALVVTAIVSILAARGLRRPRLARPLRWVLLLMFSVAAIGLTALLIVQAPWWHDWPLLLPLWMGVLAALAAWMSTQRRKVEAPPSAASP